MAKLDFVGNGKRTYKTGIDNVVLFVKDEAGAYQNGVACPGVISVELSPTGGDVEKQYASNRVYAELVAPVENEFSFECFDIPDEFDVCDGLIEAVPGTYVENQTRRKFALSFKTKIGNDTMGDDYGYQIVIIYNALAGVSSNSASTITDSKELNTFSYDCTTTKEPVDFEVNGIKLQDTSVIRIDSTKFVTEDEKAALKKVEDLLYGTETTESELKSIGEILTLLASA